MDLATTLLRTVVRDFYDIRAVIILDAIMVHHVLSDRELVSATGIGIKDVRATCARLREDHLLKEVSHRDDSGMRAYTHTVFYIRYTEAVDAIKWKVHMVENKLREEMNHQHNAQDYVCDTCGKHYEMIDAPALFDAELQQFLCELCGSALRENDPNEGKETVHEEGSEMEEFMLQLRPVLANLKAIDEVTIPDNTFESELQQYVPLIGVENAGPQSYNLPPHLAGKIASAAAKNEPSDSGITIAGSSSSRLPQQVESTFQINITSEAEQRSQQREALLEKQRLAEENKLPEWHSQSTVSTSIHAPKTESKENADAAENGASTIVAGDTGAESAMDAYFEKLQAQQGEEDDDEDEEDEFEDVV